MHTVTLSPMQKQLFQIRPESSHPRLSLRRVLWVRFLKWIDKASPRAIATAFGTAGTLLAVSLLVLAPQFALGVLFSAATWNSFRIPILLASCLLTWNSRRIYRWCRPTRAAPRSTGNPHLFFGIPVDEFASWLMETKAFKFQESMDKWGFSQGTFNKIAGELEKHGVLIRGKDNARVLQTIGYADLVRQLRKDFPLTWDDLSKTWVEKDDAYGRFLRDKSFRQRKLEETVAKKERKLERVEKKIEAKEEELEELTDLEFTEQPSAFAQVMALAENGGQ
jgi:hypothetical protein